MRAIEILSRPLLEKKQYTPGEEVVMIDKPHAGRKAIIGTGKMDRLNIQADEKVAVIFPEEPNKETFVLKSQIMPEKEYNSIPANPNGNGSLQVYMVFEKDGQKETKMEILDLDVPYTLALHKKIVFGVIKKSPIYAEYIAKGWTMAMYRYRVIYKPV